MKVATQFTVEPMRLEHIPAVAAIERLAFPQPWPPNAYRREIQENRSAHYVVARHLGSGLDPGASAPTGPPGPPDDRLTPGAPALGSLAAGSPLAGSPVPGSLAAGGDGLFDRIARFLRASRHHPEAPRSPELDAELRSIVGYGGLWLMTDEAHITTIASHPDVRGRGLGELLLLGLIDRALAVGARWLTLEVRLTNEVAQNLYKKYTFKEMGVRRRYYSDNGEDALVMWTDALDSPSFLEALARNERRLGERLGAELRLGEQARVVGHG